MAKKPKKSIIETIRETFPTIRRLEDRLRRREDMLRIQKAKLQQLTAENKKLNRFVKRYEAQCSCGIIETLEREERVNNEGLPSNNSENSDSDATVSDIDGLSGVNDDIDDDELDKNKRNKTRKRKGCDNSDEEVPNKCRQITLTQQIADLPRKKAKRDEQKRLERERLLDSLDDEEIEILSQYYKNKRLNRGSKESAETSHHSIIDCFDDEDSGDRLLQNISNEELLGTQNRLGQNQSQLKALLDQHKSKHTSQKNSKSSRTTEVEKVSVEDLKTPIKRNAFKKPICKKVLKRNETIENFQTDISEVKNKTGKSRKLKQGPSTSTQNSQSRAARGQSSSPPFSPILSHKDTQNVSVSEMRNLLSKQLQSLSSKK